MIDKQTKKLSDYRLKKAKASLHQAKLLFSDKQYDGSINRIYYAIFNTIRCLLALIKLDSRKHSGIISFFDKFFVKTKICNKELSKIAHEAFNTRQDSDYEDFFTPSKEETIQLLQNTELFIVEIEKIRSLLIKNKISLPKVN